MRVLRALLGPLCVSGGDLSAVCFWAFEVACWAFLGNLGRVTDCE